MREIGRDEFQSALPQKKSANKGFGALSPSLFSFFFLLFFFLFFLLVFLLLLLLLLLILVFSSCFFFFLLLLFLLLLLILVLLLFFFIFFFSPSLCSSHTLRDAPASFYTRTSPWPISLLLVDFLDCLILPYQSDLWADTLVLRPCPPARHGFSGLRPEIGRK